MQFPTPSKLSHLLKLHSHYFIDFCMVMDKVRVTYLYFEVTNAQYPIIKPENGFVAKRVQAEYQQRKILNIKFLINAKKFLFKRAAEMSYLIVQTVQAVIGIALFKQIFSSFVENRTSFKHLPFLHPLNFSSNDFLSK